MLTPLPRSRPTSRTVDPETLLQIPLNPHLGRARSVHVLIISNGNGEDSVAADLIAHLPSGVSASAYPMIGDGVVFAGLSELVGPRAYVPSAGWRHTKGSTAKDIKGGMLTAITPAWAFLRKARGQYDKVVAIGDGVAPLMCWTAGLPIDIYVDVFKSGYAHTYNMFERFILRRVAREIFTRDRLLADLLRKYGISAQSAGNIMLDSVPEGEYDAKSRRQHPLAVLLLPGSRQTAPANLSLQLQAIALMPAPAALDIFVAVAPGLDPDDLANATGTEFTPSAQSQSAELGALEWQGLQVRLVRGALANLVEASDVVLSQAGTATQQALGLGKPVIAMRFATDRAKRIADEQALMGEGRILTEPDPNALGAALRALLADPGECKRRGEIGRARLGGPGTRRAIIARLQQSG